MNTFRNLETSQNSTSKQGEGLLLREGTVGDREAVGKVFARSWHDLVTRIGHSKNDIDTSNLNLRLEATWVVMEGEELLGFLLLHKEHLLRLYVSPEAQGRGVGTMLLRHAMANGARQLFVDEKNEAAIRFYEAHGWTFTGHSEPGMVFPSPVLEYRYEGVSVE